MLSIILSSSVVGIEGVLIKVELDIRRGMPTFNIVGLPDAAVRESKERVIAAIKNSGYEFPSVKVTVNLAPANIKKEGALFDLPMALGILAGTGQMPGDKFKNVLVMGELSLSGRVRRIKGILPSVIMAKEKGLEGVIVPKINSEEANIINDFDVLGVSNLREAVGFFLGQRLPKLNIKTKSVKTKNIKKDGIDFKDVRGQSFPKRALEIAAAGAHNLLMIGPPGSGKTMLAKRIPTILPEMSMDEALETTKIHSVAGILPKNVPLITNRPFRSPHHTISDVALIGGGSYPRPGEVSLAHNGVLFLDELPEFRRNVLEVLRQPLEESHVVISRAVQTLTYPSKIMFVAAMNPCPCGYAGSTVKECRCNPFQIQKYLGKISGPLWDRVDLHVEVDQITYDDLTKTEVGESSDIIRARVYDARNIQKERFKDKGIYTNAEMSTKGIETYCKIDNDASSILEKAVNKFHFSARAYSRILKVARTIADLDKQDNIKTVHITEAIQYRTLDRERM